MSYYRSLSKPKLILILGLGLGVTQDPDPIYSFFWRNVCFALLNALFHAASWFDNLFHIGDSPKICKRCSRRPPICLCAALTMRRTWAFLWTTWTVCLYSWSRSPLWLTCTIGCICLPGSMTSWGTSRRERPCLQSPKRTLRPCKCLWCFLLSTSHSSILKK